MYRVDRNNFYSNEKKATVFTPEYVSEFLYNILSDHIKKTAGTIIDPCVGQGSLLKPWKKNGYSVKGIDIEQQGFPNTIVKNYLELKKGDIKDKVSLVIMNPPFNIDIKTKKYIKENYGGRPLLPEVWFQKAIELWGEDVPIVMFTPYGFRLNQTEQSKRWLKFINREYPEITSIISLPKDVFPNVLFHSEVLVFNLPKLNGHYFVKNLNHEQQRLFAKKESLAFA
jgi:type I restriction-modification system DNA methylase subunit